MPCLRALWLSVLMLLLTAGSAISDGIISLQMLEKRAIGAIHEVYRPIINDAAHCQATRISYKEDAAFLIKCAPNMSQEIDSIWLAKAIEGSLVLITPVASGLKTDLLHKMEETTLLNGLVILQPHYLSDADKRDLLSTLISGFND